jgi:pentatricopeptide repeat protein
LISACEKAGRWQEALHVLEELPTFQVQLRLLHFIKWVTNGHDVDPILLIARNKFLMIM